VVCSLKRLIEYQPSRADIPKSELVHEVTMTNEKFLEQFYQNAILKRYSDDLDVASIRWIDHGKGGDKTSIELKFGDGKELPQITGWYTLFREKRS
jgi:hypothetical protein